MPNNKYSLCTNIEEFGGQYRTHAFTATWHMLSDCPLEFVDGVGLIAEKTMEHKATGMKVRCSNYTINRSPEFDEIYHPTGYTNKVIRCINIDIAMSFRIVDGPADPFVLMDSDLFEDFIIRS